MKLLSVLQYLASALHTPIHTPLRRARQSAISNFQCQAFHTRTSLFASKPTNLRGSSSRTTRGGKRGKGRPKKDPKITRIRYHLHHPLTPRPLRLSRQRALRHWTIHRAAQLLLHKERNSRERELERQYNAMRGAMEELRLGVGDGGRLYRQAISKKGIYGGLKVGEMGGVVGNGGIPIEYTRAQTNGPPGAGWDHSWTRG